MEASNYIWFITYTSGNNGILVAVKKDKLDNADSIANQVYQTDVATTEMATKIIDKPNFLQVKLKISNKDIYIIGVRIRVLIGDGITDEEKINFKNQQLEALKEHLNSISTEAAILCGGDFNVWKNPIQNVMRSCYLVSTPIYSMGIWQDYSTLDVWSAVPYKDKNKQLFDHFISTANVKVINPTYDGWSFVNSNANEYQKRGKEDYKSDLVGCPDHDILYADVEILE